jgi:hypothetical protein
MNSQLCQTVFGCYSLKWKKMQFKAFEMHKTTLLGGVMNSVFSLHSYHGPRRFDAHQKM